jgi:hypothetical protein
MQRLTRLHTADGRHISCHRGSRRKSCANCSGWSLS